jgi:hypothetical protein
LIGAAAVPNPANRQSGRYFTLLPRKILIFDRGVMQSTLWVKRQRGGLHHVLPVYWKRGGDAAVVYAYTTAY